MTLMHTLKILKYPDNIIKEQVNKTLRLTPSDETNSKKVNGVPLVVTYNPAFKNLCQVIRNSQRTGEESVFTYFSCSL